MYRTWGLLLRTGFVRARREQRLQAFGCRNQAILPCADCLG